MPLVSMKRSPSEHDAKASVMSEPEEAYYPLTLYLDKKEIDKLGLAGCKVSDEKMLLAKVRVTSVSSGEHEGGESYSSMTLTLIEAGIEAESKSAESTLYGGS